PLSLTVTVTMTGPAASGRGAKEIEPLGDTPLWETLMGLGMIDGLPELAVTFTGGLSFGAPGPRPVSGTVTSPESSSMVTVPMGSSVGGSLTGSTRTV